MVRLVSLAACTATAAFAGSALRARCRKQSYRVPKAQLVRGEPHPERIHRFRNDHAGIGRWDGSRASGFTFGIARRAAASATNEP
jgi:hypothetical protein